MVDGWIDADRVDAMIAISCDGVMSILAILTDRRGCGGVVKYQAVLKCETRFSSH